MSLQNTEAGFSIIIGLILAMAFFTMVHYNFKNSFRLDSRPSLCKNLGIMDGGRQAEFLVFSDPELAVSLDHEVVLRRVNGAWLVDLRATGEDLISMLMSWRDSGFRVTSIICESSMRLMAYELLFFSSMGVHFLQI